MPTPSTLALFAAAALTLLVIPGPSVLYVVTRSVEQGRRAGFVSVLGLHTGTLVHIAAAATGLSALLLASATLFDIVKLAGAAYLVALGVSRLVRRVAPTERTIERASLRRVYGQGFVVNVLNPKTAIFFLSFLPQFVDPARGSVHGQVLTLGLTFMGLGLLSDGLFALVAGAAGEGLRRSTRVQHLLRWFSGASFVGLGVSAALASRK